jgi:hypothetical protein
MLTMLHHDPNEFCEIEAADSLNSGFTSCHSIKYSKNIFFLFFNVMSENVSDRHNQCY